ncbi:MAG: TlpA disulfide reductase family protein [Gammaproteobacteria bacterium]
MTVPDVKKIFLLAALWLLSTTIVADPLQDFAGKPQTIKHFAGQGKWLVVMIWASDCHVCNAEAEQYIQFHEAHKNTTSEVLGISLDGVARKAEAEAFIQRHQTTFTNLLGEPMAVAQWFTALTGAHWVGTPTFLIYNPKGELVIQQAGAVPASLIEEFIHNETQK